MELIHLLRDVEWQGMYKLVDFPVKAMEKIDVLVLVLVLNNKLLDLSSELSRVLSYCNRMEKRRSFFMFAHNTVQRAFFGSTPQLFPCTLLRYIFGLLS